jgi:hypothetical protein
MTAAAGHRDRVRRHGWGRERLSPTRHQILLKRRMKVPGRYKPHTRMPINNGRKRAGVTRVLHVHMVDACYKGRMVQEEKSEPCRRLTERGIEPNQTKPKYFCLLAHEYRRRLRKTGQNRTDWVVPIDKVYKSWSGITPQSGRAQVAPSTWVQREAVSNRLGRRFW